MSIYPNISIEHYERTKEQDDDFGITQLREFNQEQRDNGEVD